MFEISILCIIIIAIAYSVTLWLMGRREDVLHGEFVEAEQRPAQPLPVKQTPVTQPFNRENLLSLLETIDQDLSGGARQK